MTGNNEANLVIVGAFEHMLQAEQAIKALQDAGYQNEQIGFLVRNAEEMVPGELPDTRTEVATDAAGGAISGGILGGIAGAAAALLIPGLGPVLAGGILVATLGGIIVGATAGGVIGALTGMGVPEEEAAYYQRQFEAGYTIVAVNVNDRTQNPQKVRRTLLNYGATDINVEPTPDVSNTPATSSATAQATTYNPNVPPATDNSSSQPPQTQAPVTEEGRYNPNVPPATYNAPQQQQDEMQEPGRS